MTAQPESKSIAIVSYITIIGWIVAFVLYRDKKTEFNAFHIRQSLGINLLAIILTWIPVIGWILAIILFIFWILGLLGAINGETKPVPFVGAFFQDLFKTI